MASRAGGGCGSDWQALLLRANPYLKVDPDVGRRPTTGFPLFCLADGVSPAELRFGELGYESARGAPRISISLPPANAASCRCVFLRSAWSRRSAPTRAVKRLCLVISIRMENALAWARPINPGGWQCWA
jgi:hypothetical protein